MASWLAQGSHCARFSIFSRFMVQLYASMSTYLNVRFLPATTWTCSLLHGMKAYDKPNILIFGVTIGDLNFCSSFISTKQMEATALLSQLEQVSIIDLRLPWFIYVVGFFTLVQLAQSTPSSLSSKAFSPFDDIRRTFSQCMGVDTSNIAWEQAKLSLSRGGLGLMSLSHHSSAAFISSICSSGLGSQSVHCDIM